MHQDNLKPIRRIVTANDDEGRSYFVEDRKADHAFTTPGRSGYRSTNLWRTMAQGSVDAPDTIDQHRGVLPPAGGTVLRIIEWPPEPEDSAEARRLIDLTFAQMFPDADRDIQPGEHPGMHRTQTVDYAIVLEGEIVAIMDQGEAVMRAGDVLIQRGTNHAWSNRSNAPAKVAFILVDASADP